MNLLKKDHLYSIEVYPHGLLIIPAFGQRGVPMDALSTAAAVLGTIVGVDKATKVGIDSGIASALGGVFAVGTGEDLSNWRKQIAEQLAIGNTRKEIQWIRGVDTGLSSITLFCCLLPDDDQAKCEDKAAEVRSRGVRFHPYDADDYGRCLRMVEFLGFGDRIEKARLISGEWNAIINRWDELAKLYHENKLTEVTAIIKDCIGEKTKT